MPTDISHLPPAPGWIVPQDRDDPRPEVAEWLGHLRAGRLGSAPPPSPEVLARRLATAAQFAGFGREAQA